MPKTVIEKSQSSSPDVTVFSVSGTLGFHEKDTLEKLFDECKKRDLSRVVLDVSGLTSLGGGCAKIIRQEAASGTLKIGIAGAKPTVLKFLKNEGEPLLIADTVGEAVTMLENGAAPAPAASTDSTQTEAAPQPPEVGTASATLPPEQPATTPPQAEAPIPESPSVPPAEQPSETPSDARELQKRIVQYNTLFSINSDFYRIQDQRNLLELFLLTTIAQVGVESAIFLEGHDGYFTPAAAKGVEADELRGFAISGEYIRIDSWMESLGVFGVESAPMTDEVKAPLLSLGCSYVAPFVVHGEFRGMVALGKPIKNELDEGSIRFLQILINQAALAYESSRRFEEEKERTLGLVQTLISLIEENTLARGNTNLLSNYTYVLAKKLHYPEERIRDLMYGTVLRDIGMIKVSDLIVRSPRELMPEEWEIIKRHPIDGAEMLRKMKFSEHAVNIVLAHHERFNGEGYPHGLQGKQIPLGSRIVSIVESYAAMLQERPTRPALTQEEAINTLKENWGMRYDPDVVQNFVEVVEEELRTGETVQHTQFELFRV